MKLTSVREIEDFVRGLTFFGTGGGGDYSSGVSTLTDLLEKGIDIGWVDVSEIDDSDYTICPFLMGSIAPLTDETLNEMKIFGLENPIYDYKDTLSRAVKNLEERTGKKAKALVPIELGGANAAACIAASAINGIITVDGDYTGRAIPEIQQTTPFIFEKNLMPITTCDAWGNQCCIDEAINWRMAERIGKLISAAAYSACGEAGFLMTGKDTKEILVKGTMTESYKIGKKIREEREAGNDPITAITEYLDGWILCRGKVTDKDWWDKVGYYWGTHTITGEGNYDGSQVKIWFKNENHIAWKDDKIITTSPDMIIVVDNKTGEPFTNNKIEVGQEVAVIGLKARDVFRLPRGIETLGPRAFGFDVDYTPIEELI